MQAPLIQSTTVMVPCPWALHALRYLSEHPDQPFGIHLTALSDPDDYRWGPVTPRENRLSVRIEAGERGYRQAATGGGA